MALSNSQFNAILREYERLQAENRRELRERREQVYERLPELRDLEKRVAVSALERFRKGVREGDPSVAAGFSREVSEIEAEKKRLLRSAGYPEDELEPRYHCKDCRDTGLLADGKKCHCFHSRAVNLLYARSNLEKLLERENFQSFSLDWYDDRQILNAIGMTERAWMKQVEARCQTYVKRFKEHRESILFQGNTGVGKTFLSNSIAKELIEQGYAVVYLTALELFDCLAKVRMEKTEELAVQELYEYIFSCDLLILDDLGTEVPNAFSASQLFYLINARLHAERGTVISTNLSLQKLRELYSDRTTSRIASEYDILMLYGGDIRAKKRMKEMGM